MSAEPQAATEPSSVRLALTLGLAGLFAGLALVSVYELTLPIITANKAAALRKAVFNVIPAAKEAPDAHMVALAIAGDTLAVAPEGSKQELVYGVFSKGELLGYAIPGEGPGFQDVIKIIYGYNPEGEVIIGMEVLESKETPGLGDKIYKDPEFAKNFEALAVSPPIKAVKHGTKISANQVDSITGATISSVAIGKILAKTNEKWLPVLPLAAQAAKFSDDSQSKEASP